LVSGNPSGLSPAFSIKTSKKSIIVRGSRRDLMTCGIYAIVCDKTWRSYVGQSVNLESRFLGHLQLLRRGGHDNKDFQYDYNLYGESSFHFEIIERLTEVNLIGQREAYWIKSGVNLYNKTGPSNNITLTESELDRFWNWVDVRTLEECWNWAGATDKDGYGRIGFKRDGKKVMFRSNRLAYFIQNPCDDIQLIIRHTCNNSKCCNPNHLIIGTLSDNKRDILNKEHHHYKLNWTLVKAVREKFLQNSQIKPIDLNDWFYKQYLFRLPRGYLVGVCLNKNWKDANYFPPKRQLKYFVTNSDKDLIADYISRRCTHTEIYNKLNFEHKIPISKTSLSRIIKKINQDSEIL